MRKYKYKDYGDPCASCGVTLTEDNAYRKSGGRAGVQSYCKPCVRVKQRKIDRRTGYKKQRDYHARLKEEMLDAYGRKCACCGETEPLFLSVDHVKNDGYLDRNSSGRRRNTTQVMYDAKRRGWPDDYQILCRNCNWGKHANGGVCPHKKAGES